MIKFEINSDIQIFKDGEEVIISQKKLRAILAFFVVEKSVDRQKIAEIFFDGNKSLIRNSIYMINKSLGLDFISNMGRNLIAINNKIEYELDIDHANFLNSLKFKNEPFFIWKQSKMVKDFYVNQEILDTVYYEFLNSNSRNFLINGKNGVGKSEFIARLYDSVDADKVRIKCTFSEQNFSLNVIHIILNYISKYENKDFLKIFTDINYNDQKAFQDENNMLNVYYMPIDELIIKLLREELSKKYLIMIEDIEYIDEASLDLINKIIESEIPNICFVITYNTTSKREVEISGFVKQYIISNWNKDDVEKYLKHCHPQYISYCEQIYQYTNGNPFYIEIMINNLIHFDTLSLSRDYLNETFKCLSDDEITILKFVSCFNGSVHLDLIYKTFLVDKNLICNLQKLNILEIRIVNDLEKVFYKHSILKEYTYSSLEQDEKEQFHLLIATELEKKINGDNLIKIYDCFFHYSKANNLLKETEYKIRYLSLVSSYTYSVFPLTDKFDFVTDNHLQINKFKEEIEQLEQIFKDNVILKTNNNIHVKFYTLKNRYDVITGNIECVEENILKQIELCKILNNEDELIKAYYLMIYYALNIGDYHIIDNCLSQLNFIFDINKDPITKRIQGYNFILKREYHKSIFTLNEAIDLSNTLSKEKAEANLVACYAYLGEAHIITHDYKRALKDLRRGEKIVNESSNYISGSILIKLFMAISHYRLGNSKEALEYITQTYKSYDNSELCWKRCSCYLYARQIYHSCNLNNEMFDSRIKECKIKYHSDLGKWLYDEYCQEVNSL